jgi:hypothetical protein
LRGVELHDSTVAHHGDFVTEYEGLFLIVGHEDGGDLQFVQESMDLGADLDPKRAVKI